MNEELTNEALEVIAKCNTTTCSECIAVDVCCSPEDTITIGQRLATALLEERARPKDDVWKNAPDWAISAVVFWESQAQRKRMAGPVFNRELPKTRARQIAENIVHGINGETHGETKDIEYVEGVLKRYAEELINTKET